MGPFSGAVVVDNWVFTSGQIPETGNDAELSFADQVRHELANLERVLLAAGSDRHHVVKVTTYLTDTRQLETYNEIYAEFFESDRPARTTVCVASLWGVCLEIECVAAVSAGYGDSEGRTDA